MIDRLLHFLTGRGVPAAEKGADELELSVAALLIEAARMDSRFDATERATIERLLADTFEHVSAEKFRGIFKQAATGIAITDLQGRFQSCNGAYLNMLGYTEDELRALDFPRLIHPEDREAYMVQISRLLARHAPSL